jgi:2-haloacid dehalogenase
MERWATFDCYGTLIDWDAGIRAALSDLWPEVEPGRLLQRFHAVEPALEADGKRTYREVLSAAVPAVAEAGGLVVPEGGTTSLAASLPAWPPFPETAAALADLRDRGWRIAILSNTDPDYLDASLARIGVPVDLRVVASTIGSYKPAVGHWETFFRLTGADRTRHVHVAASLFHDVEPCAALGLPCLWINRLGQTSDVPRAGEAPDLRDLSDRLQDLVPA